MVSAQLGSTASAESFTRASQGTANSRSAMANGYKYSNHSGTEPYPNVVHNSGGEAQPPEEKPKEEPKKDPGQEKKPPLNKRGEPYPKMIDPRTGEPVPFPEGLKETPKEDRVEWNNKTRGEFITEWIDKGYSAPPSGWGEYDMHHILPREWGGTNDFENLVPLRRELHQLIVTPWWNTYEPQET